LNLESRIPNPQSPLLALAETAARAGADVLRRASTRQGGTRSEAGKDLKLQADVDAEAAILSVLRDGSAHPVLSEECGADAGLDPEAAWWVVDPLDGTVNYSRGLPLTCVSVGLWRAGEPVLGVVHDFERDEVFAGEVGRGATCNGASIRPSGVSEPSKAVLATGFPSARDYGDASLLAFCRRVQRFKKVRLLGSAALSLAWVAAGRLDAYFEEDIWLWDVAAGLALVTAAGGRIRVTAGGAQFRYHVGAGAAGLSWE